MPHSYMGMRHGQDGGGYKLSFNVTSDILDDRDTVYGDTKLQIWLLLHA